ncbi:MAG: tetratricopeptide repeat protein, partial [Xanthomonadales bacterium]|nr:tetratricopeptide repeat protein [Xanthomonadales bacterium]
LGWGVIEGYVTINPEKSQEKALNAATRALSIDPDNVEAMVALGSLARDQFRYSEGIDYFERAIELNPSFATAYQWYGGVLLSMGDPEAALTRYQQAWNLDPRSRIIGINLAGTLYYLDRHQEATAIAQEVYRFAPGFPEASKMLMHLAMATGECEKVAEYGNRVASVLKKTFNATPFYMDACQSADSEARANAIETMLTWTGFNFSLPDDPSLSYPEDIATMLVDMGEFDAALIVTQENSDYYSHVVLSRIRAMKSANGIKFYCDPRVQAVFEQSDLPLMAGQNICD